MQSVSDLWKQTQKLNFVPVSYVEIILNVGDPDSQADAQTTANGEEPFSDAGTLTDSYAKSPVRYATLEHNFWGLNGTFKILPDTPPAGVNGYIGTELSGDDGSFSVIPTITISFSQVFEHLIPGITITWGSAYEHEWASEFTIRAYNGSSVEAEKTITGNDSVTSIVEMDIQNYDKITIEILKWNKPGRRARIEKIIVGIEQTFTKSDLMSYSHEMTVDPLSAALPKAEINVELKNLNGEYNPDNQTGAAKYLMERQSITARYGYKLDGGTEWIPAGNFFMSEWDLPQNGITFSFSARDALEYMSDTYSGPTSGSLYDIAQAAFEQAGLPAMTDGSPRWGIDPSLADIQAPANADLGDSSIMVVLQYCANAGCCVFYQDREGLLHIEPLSTPETDYEINRFNSYSNSELSLSKQLKAVDINSGQYVLTVGTVGETQPVSNPLISDAQAPAVAAWVAGILSKRKTLSGEFRSDPRLDALDLVSNVNQFATTPVLVTSIKYSYNGAFRGSYEGREM